MSDFSLILVLQFKTSKIINGMANISIKSQEITPFGGIFHVMEKFGRYIGPVVDGELDLWEGGYTYRCILTNDYTSTTREIVEFYNLRGGKERIFDDMNNGLGWARLPKSFMAENTVFLLLTAVIRNFYKFLMERLDTKAFGLEKCSRIKAFVFKFFASKAA